MSGELLLINPRKRKAKRTTTRRKARKHTTRSRRRSAPVVVMANPSPRRRRSRLSALRSKVRHVRRKYRRNPLPRFSLGAITTMAKGAAVGAAGAVAVDVLYGYAKSMLPASMQSPTDGAGINPMYFLGKGALAVAVGVLGRKLTSHAAAMAEGSLTVQAYQLMSAMMPASIAMGYASPARVMRGAPRVGQFVSEFVSGRPAPAVTGMPGLGGRYDAPVNQVYMG